MLCHGFSIRTNNEECDRSVASRAQLMAMAWYAVYRENHNKSALESTMPRDEGKAEQNDTSVS
jgi:hypothetical protein